MVHITLAAFGLSVILAKSAMAFSIVKYAGAVYLGYLGITKLLASKSSGTEAKISGKTDTMLKIYTSGVITNVFNPKVALFFMAFFPQFIDPAYAGSILPFFSLGMIYILLDLFWCLLLTLGAAQFNVTARGHNLSPSSPATAGR